MWFWTWWSLLACNGDDTLGAINDAPEVTWLAPADGSELWAADTLVVRAEVSDDAQAPTDLDLVLASDLDGALDFELAEEGEALALTVSTPLTPGDHVLTLQAIDYQATVGSDRAAIRIRANLAPVLTFLSPTPSGLYLSGDPVPVRLLVEDEVDPSAVTLTWLGDLVGPTHPTSDGLAEFELPSATAGARTLQVSARDARGATSSAQTAFGVTESDTDGDGVRGEAYGGDDCDDSDRFVFPGAGERCNGEDDDCDGLVDEGVTDPETWYIDSDGDGAGVPGATVEACEQPSGYAFSDDDCDDADAARRPGAPERCNGLDDDCDDSVPLGELSDDDGDGTLACADCDDDDNGIFPGAPERCNGLDDDCDGSVPADELTDGDGDGTEACADCDDADPARHPGATERCNGLDDDCSGSPSPEELSDDDGDGSVTCEDCDDDDAAVSPTATERCNGVDDDCDTRIDDGGSCSGCDGRSWVDPQGVSRVYQFCPSPLPWHDALAVCTGLGGDYDLASVQSQAENDWLDAVLRGSRPETWWIGGADEWTEGDWGWSDGSAWSYANWGDGEPNNLGEEDCLAMNYFDDGTWIDAQCSSSRRFVCELSP